MSRAHIYLAHPLGDGEDRERNRANAARCIEESTIEEATQWA